jgi:hypothetical protein
MQNGKVEYIDSYAKLFLGSIVRFQSSVNAEPWGSLFST